VRYMTSVTAVKASTHVYSRRVPYVPDRTYGFATPHSTAPLLVFGTQKVTIHTHPGTHWSRCSRFVALAHALLCTAWLAHRRSKVGELCGR
jgi:hypothetical protein